MVQLYMAIFLIPRFAEIFGDMLGDQPLPASTSTVILLPLVIPRVSPVSGRLSRY